MATQKEGKKVLDRSTLNDIYKDMRARIDMGLLYNEDEELDGVTFRDHLIEAIQEKTHNDKSTKESIELDVFSIAFGILAERIAREYFGEEQSWW